MTESHIKNFNAELDRVLAGEKEPDDDLLNLANEYANLNISNPTKQLQLRHYLLTQKPSRRRWWQIAVAASAAIVILTLLVTPLRSFAQDVIDRIGDLLFTNEPTWAEQILSGDVEASSGLPPVIESIQTHSLTKAETEAPYDLYLPGHLPDGLGLPTYYVTKRSDDYVGSSIVFGGYNSSEASTVMLISQHPVSDSSMYEWAVGDAVLNPIQVRKTTGLYFKDYIGGYSDLPDGKEGIPMTMIVWEEAGFVFTVASSSYNQETLAAVAESLSPQVALPGGDNILSFDNATSRAGFPVQTSEWLPDSFRLVAVHVIENDLRMTIRQTYEDTSKHRIVWIEQFRYPFPIDVLALYHFEDTDFYETRVDNQHAVFVDEWFVNDMGLTMSLLIWQRDEDSFAVIGENLSLTEALQIAESVGAH